MRRCVAAKAPSSVVEATLVVPLDAQWSLQLGVFASVLAVKTKHRARRGGRGVEKFDLLAKLDFRETGRPTRSVMWRRFPERHFNIKGNDYPLVAPIDFPTV